MSFFTPLKLPACFTFGAACCLMFAEQATSLPKIETWINADQVPVYFVHSPEPPMLDLHLIFKAGAVHEELQGVASMTGEMLKRGSEGMDVEQTNEAIDALGAAIGTSGSKISTDLTLRTLTDSEYLEKSLTLLIRILSTPTFPEEELLHLKKKRQFQLRTQNDKPGKILARVTRETVYAGHPYASDLIGTEASLEQMTVEHLKDFYRTYIGTENMVITAVGAISKAELTAIANRITAAIGKAQKASAVPEVPPLKTAAELRIPFPSQQAHIKIAQPFIRTGHPDFFKLRLGNHILGGSGFGSRVMSEVRTQRGLAYSAYSTFDTRPGGGIFSASLQTRTDQADEAVEVLKDTIQTFVIKGPSAEEVELARNNIRGGFSLGLDSNGKIHSILDQIAFHDLGTDYLDTYLSHFETITPQDIIEAFEHHLHPDKMATIIVGGKTHVSE